MISYLAWAFLQTVALATSVPTAQQEDTEEDSKPVVTGFDSCLPMQFADGLPVITSKLAGRDVNLGFDTGAPGPPTFDPAIIKELKLLKIGEALMTDPSGKNPLAVGLHDLPNLKVGNINIGKWYATARPEKEGRRFTEPDGIIGLTAFEGYIVTFDYPGRRVLLTKGRLPEPDGRFSFRYEGPMPRVPLSIEGHMIEGTIDTGNARYGLIVPEKFAAQLAAYSSRYPIGIARTVNNQFDLMALPIRDSKVGDFPLYAGTIAFPAVARRANIGSLILKDLVLKVDPANSIVSLERAKLGMEYGCPKA